MNSDSPPHDYMALALDLATQGRFTVSPNPMVGCVIVKHNRIIGTGFHQYTGGPHAEIHALAAAGEKAAGASAYVTLEPCCHYGKTPPCTEALIQAKIKKVYVAVIDPNPLVNGKGIEKLRAAGIEVEVGLHEQSARQLNEIFFYYIRHQRPFVIAKWAMSWDGKTITQPQDDKKISNQQSQQAAHEWRQAVDAILIGANTAINDDPQLTARFSCLEKGTKKQPKRIILSTDGKLPTHLKLFNDEFFHQTIIATTAAALTSLSNDVPHIETLVLPKNNNGRVDLSALLTALAEKKITSLLVEGGMTVHEDFFSAGLVNKVHIYLAPVIIGQLKNKKNLHSMTFQQLDNDCHLTATYLPEE